MKGARINFGVPNSEYVLLADDTGAAVSLKNQDTDTEYIGGSSDFGTAEVTFTFVNQPELINIDGVYIANNEMSYGTSVGEGYNPYNATFVLYKGEQKICIYDENYEEFDPSTLTISTTGGVELDSEGEGKPYFYVRGNGTITIEFL